MTLLNLPGKPLETTWVRAIAHDPSIYALAAQLPERSANRGGRPGQFPDAIYLIFAAMIGSLRSGHRAALAMHDPVMWQQVLDGVRTNLGDEVADRLPDDHGPTRNQWLYNSKYLAAHISTLEDGFANVALTQALRQGHFVPTKERTAMPDRSDWVVGDGTVPASPIKKSTIERSGRQAWAASQGIGTFREGGEQGDNYAYGMKYVFISTRQDSRWSRVILSVRQVQPGPTDYGGESGMAADIISDLIDRAPGIRGVAYDGAFRGKHRNRLMKKGAVVVTPHHKRTVARALKRVECDCGDAHDLWTENGTVAFRKIRIDGSVVLEPLVAAKTYARPNKDGWRWYNNWLLPCGQILPMRIDTTRDDDRQNFNRAEHIQQHAPGGPIHKELYGYRPDAESMNSQLDDALFNRRMVAYSATRATLVMLGFALAQNAMSAANFAQAQPGESRAA